MNSSKVAVALRALADAFEEGGQDAQTPAAQQPSTPRTRGRGRPVTGEGTDTSAPASSAAVPEADPFGETAAPATTLQQVRGALTDLKNAVNQEAALKALKDAGGAANITDLKPEKYGAVVKACTAALETSKPVVKQEEDDPFALPGEKSLEAEPLTIEAVKAVITETQKRTGIDAVQKVVMAHGGKGKNPDSGVEGASLKLLPAANYAATVAALKALPTTK